jgi:hypothetical protein
MELPKFDRVPMSIPLWTVFAREHAAALSSAKELFLALGGSKSSECAGENSSLAARAGAVEELLSRKMKMRRITRLTSETSPMDPPFPLISCNIFKGEALEAVLNVDFHIFYVFYLDFLERLKKRRPAVYRLLRLIVRGIQSYMPCETVASVSERRFDMYNDELDELAAAGEHEAVKEIKREQREFRKHLKWLKIPPEVFKRRLMKTYKRVSASLRPCEERWVKTAIEMFEHALAAGNMEYRFDDAEDGERIDLNCCFNLLWKEGSYLSDSTIHEYECCEVMGPMVRVVVKSKADVEKFVRLIRMYYLFAKLLSTGGRTWR